MFHHCSKPLGFFTVFENESLRRFCSASCLIAYRASAHIQHTLSTHTMRDSRLLTRNKSRTRVHLQSRNRHIELSELTAAGYSDEQIASRLNLSTRYVADLRRKAARNSIPASTDNPRTL